VDSICSEMKITALPSTIQDVDECVVGLKGVDLALESLVLA
jgi:hypothetical protein